MEQRMRYMTNVKDVVIIDKKQKTMVVAAEGAGDNLWEDDEAQGYNDQAAWVETIHDRMMTYTEEFTYADYLETAWTEGVDYE